MAPMRLPMGASDWEIKRSWLLTQPYFLQDPSRLSSLRLWNHPWQQPYLSPGDPNWYSSHQPRDRYKNSECNLCHLIGHIKWNCPMYICPHCRIAGIGHKPHACPDKGMDHSHDRDRVSMALVPNLGLAQRIFSQKYPDSTTAINDLLASLKPKYVPARGTTPPPFSVERASYVERIRQPVLPLNVPPFRRDLQVAFRGRRRTSPYLSTSFDSVRPTTPATTPKSSQHSEQYTASAVRKLRPNYSLVERYVFF